MTESDNGKIDALFCELRELDILFLPKERAPQFSSENGNLYLCVASYFE